MFLYVGIQFVDHFNNPTKLYPKPTVFTLDICGQKQTVSVDQLKPAFLMNAKLKIDNIVHATIITKCPQYKTHFARNVRFRMDPKL
ncbi:hypothetical protein TNCV_2854431 [Trichonephila clavipes]|nr:hypothetical protein TNCV_2854431 [Trichonephila clavipes]